MVRQAAGLSASMSHSSQASRPYSFLASKHFCVPASRPHSVLASQLHSFLAFQQATGKMIKYKCYVKLLLQIA